MDIHRKYNLQIHYNLMKFSMAFSQNQKKNKTKHAIYMETHKIPNSQSSLESTMKLEDSTCLISAYTTELQSSKEKNTGTKTEIQTSGTRQKAQKYTHTPMHNLIPTKVTIIYNGAKTASSINGVTRRGQPFLKE